ncbi:MAG: hypothetical protein WB799_00275 [Candidatus Sulfotelmatobacter sp.]
MNLFPKWVATVFVVVGVLFLQQRPISAHAAAERHDECVRASLGSLGNVILKNVCSDRVDMKWCHMTTDGRNIGCQVERDLNPGWHVETGVCPKCRWKVNYEIFLTSNRGDAEFSSDIQMLASLKSKQAIM